MYKLLVFAGTTEGRMLLGELAELPVEVLASVATEYGRECLPHYENITVQVNRLTVEQMAELMEREKFDWVIDSTHPYAIEVTANIQQACKETDTSYLRLIREGQSADRCRYVKNLQEAVEVVEQLEGNILLTTGSKELEPFTKLTNYQERVFPRVLPMVEAIEKCLALGFPGRNIIAMQGPFSEELNVALLKSKEAKFMVTKESGNSGGFQEKLDAAEQAGATVIVIERPKENNGFSMEEIVQMISCGSKK